MSICRCALLVLALVVSACASSLETPLGEAGQAARPVARGGPNLILRAELEEYRGESAYRTIDFIRRRWVRPIRSNAARSVYARVVIDGSLRRELNDLRLMSVDSIETMRYLTATDATTKYGIGYPGGVIEVTTRGRR